MTPDPEPVGRALPGAPPSPHSDSTGGASVLASRIRWFTGANLLWPLAGLGLLLLFNTTFSSGFFTLKILDGRLYGIPVDIFHQGSKVMLLAMGMTLVIATGGVDLSVGSIMAITGAVAAVLVTQAQLPLAAIVAISVGKTPMISALLLIIPIVLRTISCA